MVIEAELLHAHAPSKCGTAQYYVRNVIKTMMLLWYENNSSMAYDGGVRINIYKNKSIIMVCGM